MADRRTTLLQGTLDLLILKAVATGELHGLGVSRRIDQITGGTFVVQPGSLFPALHRLGEAGWVPAALGVSRKKRRAEKFPPPQAGRPEVGGPNPQGEPGFAANAPAPLDGRGA